jgi:hypothetical protein
MALRLVRDAFDDAADLFEYYSVGLDR